MEVQSSVKLLRSSCIHINDKSFTFQLGIFIDRFIPNLRSSHSSKLKQSCQLKSIDYDKGRNCDIRSIFGDGVTLYNTLIFNSIRFTVLTQRKNGQKDDSCVLYKLANKIRVGFIISIVRKNSHEDDCIVRIRYVPINKYLSIDLNNT